MGTLTGTLILSPVLAAAFAVKPRYEHDCEDCVFLGHVDCDEIRPRDAYACRADGCLVLRYGDDPEKNTSYPAVARNMIMASGVTAPELRLGVLAHDAWERAGKP